MIQSYLVRADNKDYLIKKIREYFSKIPGLFHNFSKKI